MFTSDFHILSGACTSVAERPNHTSLYYTFNGQLAFPKSAVVSRHKVVYRRV